MGLLDIFTAMGKKIPSTGKVYLLSPEKCTECYFLNGNLIAYDSFERLDNSSLENFLEDIFADPEVIAISLDSGDIKETLALHGEFSSHGKNTLYTRGKRGIPIISPSYTL